MYKTKVLLSNFLLTLAPFVIRVWTVDMIDILRKVHKAILSPNSQGGLGPN